MSSSVTNTIFIQNTGDVKKFSRSASVIATPVMNKTRNADQDGPVDVGDFAELPRALVRATRRDAEGGPIGGDRQPAAEEHCADVQVVTVVEITLEWL